MAKKKRTGYYMESDGRHVYKTCETYKDVTWICKGTSYESYVAAKAAWQRNKEKRIALINGEKDKREGKIKLRKAMTEWYDLYVRGKMTHGRPRSALTISTDEIQMGKIFEELGDMMVCDIDADILQAYFNKLAKLGTGDSIIRKRWILLNMFFNKFNPRTNPLTLCCKPQTVQSKAKWSTDVEDEVNSPLAYTDAEMELLTKILLEKPSGRNPIQAKERGHMLIVIMWQFLRLAEAAELRVKDIDFKTSTIRIRRQYDELHKIVVIPKDNSKRDMPISEYSLEILRVACAGKQPDELVFCGDPNNEHGGRVLRGALRDTLTAACSAARLTRHVVHDLRHDGISYYVRKGVKPQSIQKWAGHSSLSVTLDIYYRSTGEDDPTDRAIMTGYTEEKTA